MVSIRIGSGLGTTARRPKALRYTTLPLAPIRTTAPGHLPSLIAFSITGAIAASGPALWLLSTPEAGARRRALVLACAAPHETDSMSTAPKAITKHSVR